MYCQTGNVHVQEVKVIAVKIFWPARLLRPWAHRIVLHCIAIASYYTIILRCLHNPFLSLCSFSPNTRSLSLYPPLAHTLSVALIRLLFHDCSIFVFVISFWDKFASFPFHFIVILVVSLIAASFIFVVFVYIYIYMYSYNAQTHKMSTDCYYYYSYCWFKCNACGFLHCIL